jgi:hypothetical protein
MLHVACERIRTNSIRTKRKVSIGGVDATRLSGVFIQQVCESWVLWEQQDLERLGIKKIDDGRLTTGSACIVGYVLFHRRSWMVLSEVDYCHAIC